MGNYGVANTIAKRSPGMQLAKPRETDDCVAVKLIKKKKLKLRNL